MARMTRGEVMALAKQAAKAMADLERLTEQYGEDKPPGTVIRFRKRFPFRNWDAFPTTYERHQALVAAQNMTYTYAAIRADNGMWYVTGVSKAISNEGVEWEELLDFMDEGVPAEGYEIWPATKAAIEEPDEDEKFRYAPSFPKEEEGAEVAPNAE